MLFRVDTARNALAPIGFQWPELSSLQSRLLGSIVISARNGCQRYMKRSIKEQRRTQEIERLAYSIREFAGALCVSPGLIRLEITRGRLRPARVGGRRVVIPVEEAKRYFDEARGQLNR
jgi:hypothetical protein